MALSAQRLPPWYTVYHQPRRWLDAGIFEQMAHDLRGILRLAEGRKQEPTATLLDARTIQSAPESGQRAGYDGAQARAPKCMSRWTRWGTCWLGR